MASQNFCDSRDNEAEDLGFSNYFSHLLHTKKCVDVTFVLQVEDGEVEFFAHQLILAMMSPFFADKFYDDQRDKKHQIIRLEKVNPKTIEDMLRYFYGCKPALETIDEISALVRTASQFEIKSLINFCHSCLRDTEIKSENVFSILEVSEFLQNENLKDMCHKFLENNTGRVIAVHDLRNVTATMIQNIIDLQKLSLTSEYELIRWIFDWAKVKSEEVSAGKSAREYLEKFLKALNFLALTSEEFAFLCKDYPDFLCSDEIASISLNIATPGSREMPSWYDKSAKLREYSAKELDMQIENTNRHLETLLTEFKGWQETCLLTQNYISMIHSMESSDIKFLYYQYYFGKEATEKLRKLFKVLAKGGKDVEQFRKTLENVISDVGTLNERFHCCNFSDRMFTIGCFLEMSQLARRKNAKKYLLLQSDHQKDILKEMYSALDEKGKKLYEEIEKVEEKLCRMRRTKSKYLNKKNAKRE